MITQVWAQERKYETKTFNENCVAVPRNVKLKLPNKKRNIQHGIRYANFGGKASLDHIAYDQDYSYNLPDKASR
jgi:hypothetical protein